MVHYSLSESKRKNDIEGLPLEGYFPQEEASIPRDYGMQACFSRLVHMYQTTAEAL